MSMAIERLTECIRRAVQHAQFRNFYRDRFDSHAMRELYARNRKAGSITGTANGPTARAVASGA